MDSGVDERRQRAFVFGAVLGIGAAALARRRSGAVAEAIAVMPVTGLTGIGCLAAGEHIAIAVFARTQLAVAAARTLPGAGHRAVFARESGDGERLRNRRIVDLALVEDLAGRVRGGFEQLSLLHI